MKSLKSLINTLDRYIEIIKDYKGTMEYDERMNDEHYNEITIKADRLAYRMQKICGKL